MHEGVNMCAVMQVFMSVAEGAKQAGAKRWKAERRMHFKKPESLMLIWQLSYVCGEVCKKHRTWAYVLDLDSARYSKGENKPLQFVNWGWTLVLYRNRLWRCFWRCVEFSFYAAMPVYCNEAFNSEHCFIDSLFLCDSYTPRALCHLKFKLRSPIMGFHLQWMTE